MNDHFVGFKFAVNVIFKSDKFLIKIKKTMKL